MKYEKIPVAIREACTRAGGQIPLAELSGVSQGQISDYLCNRRKIENMTLGTFFKLFPEAEVKFFKDGDFTGETKTESSIMERQMLQVFRNLSPDEQARCLMIMAVNFPGKIKAETI